MDSITREQEDSVRKFGLSLFVINKLIRKKYNNQTYIIRITKVQINRQLISQLLTLLQIK